MTQVKAETRSKVVLITGAGRRIGRTLALDLAAHGWRVAVHYNRSAEAATQVVQEITEAGGQAVALGADLADLQAVKGLLPACAAHLGPPLCLINNASIFKPDSIAPYSDKAMDETSWTAHLDINLRAPVFLAQAFARALPEDVQGNIINILDQKVLKLTPYFFSYTLSKAGLFAATTTMAQALAPRIRVNAIGPGPTLPNERQSEQEFAEQCAKTPLGVGTSPQEIAAAVRFILDAPAMTGQMIALDGGRHLAWQTPDVTNKHD